ncbi:hypothetical protein J4Q44_G00270030 [Coregonus suidteri]|uniref:Uncharacterized protein n=1 Tax=Coregonus suidteri TaxID=861788 RepID=A0AAN8L2W0_9TELE
MTDHDLSSCLDSFPTSTISAEPHHIRVGKCLLVKVKTEPINNSEIDYHRKQHWIAMHAKELSFMQCW